MKKAVIVGSRGQDGYYLEQNLRSKGYRTIGIDKSGMSIAENGAPEPFDILDERQVAGLLKQEQPQEIYYLAAVHQSAEDIVVNDLQLFSLSLDVHVRGLNNFLGGITDKCPGARLFYAASSHLFSGAGQEQQDEQTPRQPSCIYSITKSAGVDLCHFYRSKYGVHNCVGYLFNHESPRRSPSFVSRKIVKTAVEIKKGILHELVLGDLESLIDWGYAPDYVEAMNRILQVERPDDFIISSGALHTVRDFVHGVFNYLELDWQEYVSINPGLIKKQGRYLFGNNRHLKQITGWQPEVTFDNLIKIMVDEELNSFGE